MDAHDSLGFILAPSPWMHISQIHSPKIRQRLLWNENISCHINKQDLSPPSAISGLQMWTRAPQTENQQMPPAPTVTAEELGECKQQDDQGNRTGPESWAAHERSEFRDPLPCILSCTECYKFLNLIPDLWCSDCLLPLLQTYLYISWLPLLTPWSSFLKATEMLSPRLGVLNIPTK